jgi:biotin carboxyl carrier protein
MPEYRFQWGDETVVVAIEAAGASYAVIIEGDTVLVRAVSTRAGEWDLAWEDGRRLVAWVAAAGNQRWVALAAGPQAGRAFELSRPQPASRRTRARQAGGRETLAAQMPGVVRRVLVGKGEQVIRGQTLLVLEAMKMEIRINAPEAGTVTAVSVAEGQSVERGQRLVELSATAQLPAR